MRLISFCAALAGLAAWSLFPYVAAAAGPTQEAAAVSKMTVPLGAAAPQVDGQVREGEWADASLFQGMVNCAPRGKVKEPLGFASQNPTHVYLKADGKHLYAAWQAMRLFGDPLVQNAANTGRPWRDDSVELVLFNPQRQVGVVLVVTSANVVAAERFTVKGAESSRDPTWKPQWAHAVQVHEGQWEGELAVAWEWLGGAPAASEEWRFNFKRYQPTRMWSSFQLSLTPRGRETEGIVRFEPGLALRVGRMGLVERETAAVELEIKGMTAKSSPVRAQVGIYPVSAEGELRLMLPVVKAPATVGGMQFEERSLRLGKGAEESAAAEGESRRLAARLPVTANAQYVARLRVYRGEQLLAAQDVPFEAVWLDLIVNVRKWLLQQQRIDVELARTRVVRQAAQVRAQLGQSAAQTADLPADGPIVVPLSTAALSPGTHPLKIQLLDAAHQVLAERQQPLVIAQKPEWWGNNLGKTDEQTVLPPWTPIQKENQTLRLLGRSYSFDQGILPSQVDAWGRRMLAGPVRLVAKINGQAVTLTAGPVEIIKQTPAIVHLRGTLSGGGLSVKATVEVEYDGMLLVRMVAAEHLQADVQELFLEIPYAVEHTPLYWHFFLGMKLIDSYTTPERPWGDFVAQDGWHGPFTPTFRLHNREYGLDWWAQSPRNWVNVDLKKQIEVLPVRDGVRVFRARLIDRPVRLERPREFEWGLFALPARPPQRYWEKFTQVYTVPLDENQRNYHVKEGYHNPNQATSFWLTGRPSPADYPRGVMACYPLRGNISGQQGTLELQVGFPAESKRLRNDVLWLDLGGQDGLRLRAIWKEGKASFQLAAALGGTTKTLVNGAPAPIPQPGFSHVALTWRSGQNGTELTLLVDGKVVGSGQVERRLAEVDFRGNFLLLGGQGTIVIDEVRLSRRARDAAELVVVQPLNADADTLLLDHLDQSFVPNDYRQTQAARISGESAESGAWVDLFGRFVAGRFGQGLELSLDRRLSTQQMLAAVGAQIVHCHWALRNNFDGRMYVPQNQARGELLKDWVKAVQAQGMKASAYHCKLVSTSDPHYTDWGDELLQHPFRGSAGNLVLMGMGQASIDFFVWTVAERLKNFGLDVTHVDYATPWPTDCLEQGLGYVDDQGQRQLAWPILAHREAYRRAYALHHGVGGVLADGYFKQHMSDGFLAASCSFSDFNVSYELEESMWGYDSRGLAALERRITPQRYQGHYMHELTGITPTGGNHPACPAALKFLFDGLHQGYCTYITGLNRYKLATVDDIFQPVQAFARLPRSSTNFNIPEGYTLGRATYATFEQFRGAEFLPPWRNEKYVKVISDPAKAQITVLLDRQKREALLIVGNLTSQVQEVHFTIDLREMGFEHAVVASVYERRVLEPATGRYSTQLWPEGVQLLRLKAMAIGAPSR